MTICRKEHRNISVFFSKKTSSSQIGDEIYYLNAGGRNFKHKLKIYLFDNFFFQERKPLITEIS